MSAERKIVTACIIDDDSIFIYGFKKFMELKGIFAEMCDFNNGQQALNFFKDPANEDNLPDILFVDINMPVMDGWDFIKNFEAIYPQLGKKISIYAISSSVDLNDIKRAKNNPLITDYILKPIDNAYITQIFTSYDIELKNIS